MTSLKEYSQAEGRIKESILLRCSGIPHHTYPGRDEDLATIRTYHTTHGTPPAGIFARLWWQLRGGGRELR